jgi:hypothetical protein
MICWSITAYTATEPDDVLIDANAATTYTDAHRAAGDAAHAALDHIAGEQPHAVPFLTISIDDEPLLLACASKGEHGTVDHASLKAAAAHVRDTGQAYTPSTTPW